jgi:hypothetical protein
LLFPSCSCGSVPNTSTLRGVTLIPYTWGLSDVINARDEDEASSRAELSQKPYSLSPVHDRKRRGSRGLLSQLAVHAARRDE